jgi:general secretion pathway protein K
MSTRASFRCQVHRRWRRDDGVVLILAVFAVTLLAVLAVGITAAVRVEMLASRTSLDRMQALFLAEAGKNTARAVLFYEDPAVDTLLDEWGPKPTETQPLNEPHELGDGFYRVQVQDACGRIDLNEADYGTLLRLVGDAGVAAAIVDWRDKGEGEMSDGAERDYYEAEGVPYAPRDADFESTGELLLVRGVTPDMYFGTPDRRGLVDLVTVGSESPNTDAQGQPRFGLNQLGAWDEPKFRDTVMSQLGSVLSMYDAEEIFRGFMELRELGLDGYTSLAQLASAAGLDYGKIAQIIDYLTVDTALVQKGKVNLNTAPVEVIAALPGSSMSVAEGLVDRRDKEPFQSLGDVVTALMQLPDGPAVFEQMIDRVTTKSSTFLIESMGSVAGDRTHRTLSALVRRSKDGVFVIRQVERDWPLPPLEDQQPTQMARR